MAKEKFVVSKSRKLIIELFIIFVIVFINLIPLSLIHHKGPFTFRYRANITYTLTDYDDKIGDNEVVIPSEVDGKTVVKIADNAFNSCEKITSVTIPATVTSIGKNAFANCISLETVNFLGDIKTIDVGVFANCISLKNINIPQSVTSINDRAFANCKSLVSVNLPSGITKISDNTFANCISLENVYIPEEVVSVGIEAFTNCTSLKTINLPNGLKEIKDKAFNNTGLISCLIPNSVEKLGLSVFSADSKTKILCEHDSKPELWNEFSENNIVVWGVESLGEENNLKYAKTVSGIVIYDLIENEIDNIVIPEKILGTDVVAIASHTFEETNIKSLSIPNTVSTIGSYAFAKTHNLVSVEFGVGSLLNEIAGYTFLDCDSLKNIIIPSDVKSIGYRAFSGCRSLEGITLNNKLEMIKEGAFTGCTSLLDITIPDSVTKIGEYAFQNCPSLTTVVLSNNIKTIENSTFYKCNALTNIILPNSLESIGDKAFYECFALTEFIFPETLKSIGNEVFYKCSSLKEVTFSEGLLNIGDHAFYNNSISSIIIPNSVETMGLYPFSSQNFVNIYAKVLEKPRDWNNFWLGQQNSIVWGFIEMGENDDFKFVKTADAIVIVGLKNNSLENVVIPNSIDGLDVKMISGMAFGNTQIKSIIISNTIKIIDKYAFYNCINLLTVNFELNSTLEIIENNAFTKCISLKEITIPLTVTYVGRDVFTECSDLIIHLETTTVPSTWNQYWNSDNNTVININE